MGKSRIWIGIGTLAVVAVAAVLASARGSAHYDRVINAVNVHLDDPDAYISTPAISRLPRDLVKAPILRDVLTEDFAFYYEEHEDRLGLRGAIKRIAYEHDKTLSDRLLETALDEPAEMAFWVDAKGAPRYWLMAMTRGILARTVQELGSLAAADTQLSSIATLRVGTSDVTAYALTLSPRRTLVLLSLGERVVVLSDPGLLFDKEERVDPAGLGIVAGLLTDDAKAASFYRRQLGLGPPSRGHTIVAGTRMLSFGYQHFFPGLTALRFDLEGGGAAVRTSLRVSSAGALPAAPADRALWAAMPVHAAACALLPVEWAQLKELIGLAGKPPLLGAEQKRWAEFAEQLDGPAAVCWYSRSQLHTPVLVARAKAGGPPAAFAIDAFARWLAPAKAGAVPIAPRQGASRWQSEIEARWGPRGGATPTYRPTFALQGRWITFSPDDALVDLALDTQAGRYASLAETLPAEGASLAVLEPRRLAELVRREAFLVISPEQELFRQAAEQRLVPRLAALAKLPAVRAVATGSADANGWVGVEWQVIGAPAPAAAAPAASAAASTRAASTRATNERAMNGRASAPASPANGAARLPTATPKRGTT